MVRVRAFPRMLPWLVGLTVVLRLGALAWSLAAHPELPEVEPVATGVSADGRGPRPALSTLGFEASNIAGALVCRGRGFADPFGARTGPTAWISPGVVAVYATAFGLFGCFAPGAVVLVFAVGVGISALMTVLMAVGARRLFDDDRAAVTAAVLFAVSPFDLALFSAASTLDLNLHGFFLLLLSVLLLGLGRKPPPFRLGLFALTAAVATLFNPVFVAVAAGGLVWLLWGAWRRMAVGLVLLAVAHGSVVGPYVAYQRQALGMWVWVKSNAFFELRLGNRPEVAGVPDEATFRRFHPSQSPEELDRYRRLGEAGYLRLQRRRFLDRTAPTDFARWTLRRLTFYFFGYRPMGFERSAGWVILKGLVYSLVGVVFLLYPMVARLRRGRLRREEGLVVVMTLLYAAPHLVALVMKRYVLPVTPLALLLVAGAVVGLHSHLGPRLAPRPSRLSS